MIMKVLIYLKNLLFGCKKKTQHQKWLEQRVEEHEVELKEIEEEDSDIDSVIERLNK